MKVRIACLFAVAAAGCGPLSQPLPQRPDDETQKKIDAAWDAALAPPNKHDRQTWMDLFVLGHAHEYGVDRLHFRSEKLFAGGKVVMEVSYERVKPDADKFVMTVYGPAGNVVREESYTRAEVDAITRDLRDPLVSQPAGPADPPELARRKADYRARLDRVAAIVPADAAAKK